MQFDIYSPFVSLNLFNFELLPDLREEYINQFASTKRSPLYGWLIGDSIVYRSTNPSVDRCNSSLQRISHSSYATTNLPSRFKHLLFLIFYHRKYTGDAQIVRFEYGVGTAQTYTKGTNPPMKKLSFV